MNFFELQDKARKHTSKLVFYFILAIILIILAIDCLILGLILFSTYPDSSNTIHFTLNGTDATLVQQGKIDFQVLTVIGIGIAAAISPVILLIIGIGTLIRMIQTRGGGISIAQMVKARPIDSNVEDFKEKRFVNIVEEMSIASGVPVPLLFVMDNEPAINAFVAGKHPEDMVMVVTKGALDTLNRDELQGVVGHEFSHIFNGDMRISLRLIGLLGGIFAIGQLGGFILRSLMYSSNSRSSNSSSDNKGNGTLVIIILGVGLFIIGYVGLFFGRLIKAAISRQRESLADACGVQYTRNPQGLINALKAIQTQGSKLQSSHAEDVNHMCFGPSLSMWFSSLLASHPPLEDRIKALGGDDIYSQTPEKAQTPPQTTRKSQPGFGSASAFTNAVLPMLVAATDAKAIENSIGNPQQIHIDYAKQILADIPDEIQNVCHSSQEVELIFYAIMLPSDQNKDYLQNLLKTYLDDNTIAHVLQYHQQLNALSNLVTLPIIDIALPSFKQKNNDEKTKVITTLEALAAVNSNLLTFSIIAMIKKSATSTSARVKPVNISTLLPEVAQLISFILFCGKNDAQTSSMIYQQLMSQFTKKVIPEPVVDTIDINAFQALLIKLNTLDPLSKQKLLHACFIAIEVDQRILIEEAQALRTIAACLNCPVPPILPTMTD